MSEPALEDLSDLTDEEQKVLSQIVEGFRRSRTPGTADEAFARFWDKVRASRSPMPDEEADTIAAEAVAFARDRG